ncbi:MAG: hypothetical protein A2V88_04730 [Elusimicrobia bacterium RBG_16_66_12]|nr:MAG: hypothetical protein A2V88_04730 [Elusimicrobia bacterium RBG_16_66_12]
MRRSRNGGPEVKATMAATETRSMSERFASPWRDLGRAPTYQVPVVLGGFIAALAGIVTYALDIANASQVVVASAGVIYLIIFGAMGLIGYSVSKRNAQNGSTVAAIAGIALATLVGGTTGLFTGLLLLAGAVWGLATNS